MRAVSSSLVIFLSTLSLRRATAVSTAPWIPPQDFYPRSPCGERPLTTVLHWYHISISIHALLAESDGCPAGRCTHPADISIHALLAESDAFRRTGAYIHNISIHALLAESDKFRMPVPARIYSFLSTLSLRRATHAPNRRPYH